MPFISASLKDAHEDKPVPEGNYDLTIKTRTLKKSRSGKDMILCIIGVDEHPDAAPIYHNIMLEGDPEWQHLRLRDLRRFLEVFNIPYDDNGFNDDDLEGAQGNCLVKLGTDDKENEVNQLALPKFKDEPKEEEAPRRKAAGRRR